MTYGMIICSYRRRLAGIRRRLRPALYSRTANRARKRSRPMRVTIAGAWRAPLARTTSRTSSSMPVRLLQLVSERRSEPLRRRRDPRATYSPDRRVGTMPSRRARVRGHHAAASGVTKICGNDLPKKVDLRLRRCRTSRPGAKAVRDSTTPPRNHPSRRLHQPMYSSGAPEPPRPPRQRQSLALVARRERAPRGPVDGQCEIGPLREYGLEIHQPLLMSRQSHRRVAAAQPGWTRAASGRTPGHS